VLKNIDILWEKSSAKKFVQNGGQKPRWRHLKKNSCKISTETSSCGFLRNNFLAQIG
jgi:hypothetical protein